MGYRDLLRKHGPRTRPEIRGETEFIPHIQPALTYAKARVEATNVINDPEACPTSRGVSLVLLERKAAIEAEVARLAEEASCG